MYLTIDGSYIAPRVYLESKHYNSWYQSPRGLYYRYSDTYLYTIDNHTNFNSNNNDDDDDDNNNKAYYLPDNKIDHTAHNSIIELIWSLLLFRKYLQLWWFFLPYCSPGLLRLLPISWQGRYPRTGPWQGWNCVWIGTSTATSTIFNVGSRKHCYLCKLAMNPFFQLN